MSLDSLIADTRKAITEDAAKAQAAFAAQGTLVGVTEVDVRTGAHTFKVDEPPARLSTVRSSRRSRPGSAAA
jgi:hypothetical protein